MKTIYQQKYVSYELANEAAITEINAQVAEQLDRFNALGDKCSKLDIVGIQPSYNISNIQGKAPTTLRHHNLKNLFIPSGGYELSQIHWTVHNKNNNGKVGGFKSFAEALSFIEGTEVGE